MADPIYDNLHEDDELAFLELEQHFRILLARTIEDSNQNGEIEYHRKQYCNKVVAAAKSLSIDHLKDYVVQSGWEYYEQFETDVENLVIQIQIKHARRNKKYSVGFDNESKRKIRHYIEQIRLAVETSALLQNKRDAIFKKLSELTLEIDRARTRFEVVADAIRSVSRLGGEIAEPYWKWAKLILGEVDDAKDNEPQSSLPSPAEKKQLEAPRKQLPSPKDEPNDGNLDDEIPF